MPEQTLNILLLFVLVAILVGTALFLYKRLKRKRGKSEKKNAIGNARMGNRQAAQTVGGARRRVTARMHRANDDDQVAPDNEEETNYSTTQTRRGYENNQERSDDSEQDDGSSAKKLSTSKMGTKKTAKLAEKQRRKEEREAEERYREHQRKIEDEEIRKRKLAEAAEEKAEAEQEAEKQRQIAAQKAREQAAYEKMAAKFVIEEEGTDVASADEVAAARSKFIDTIKTAKVIAVEHLAMEFSMKTDNIVEWIRDLQSTGELTGVLDDRGKFVYISKDEFEKVARFIECRGRVSLAEITAAGPSLISTTGN